MREGLSILLAACGGCMTLMVMVMAFSMFVADLVDMPHVLLLALSITAAVGLFAAAYAIGREP